MRGPFMHWLLIVIISMMAQAIGNTVEPGLNNFGIIIMVALGLTWFHDFIHLPQMKRKVRREGE